MKTLIAPNGDQITVPDGRIMTYGLDDEQNSLVGGALPTKEYELFVTVEPTDLIAIAATALIINAASLKEDDRNMLFDYYTEVGNCSDETVFWIGEPKPPRSLNRVLHCYDSFDEFAERLKYHLLTAHSKLKKTKDFSKKLADCLMILSLIRLKPGIRTRELVDRMELPARTVQRYISTLQAAGEWIAYDHGKKGWYLQDGISVLFGDLG